MNLQRRVVGSLSVVLILAFFLPWVSVSALFVTLSLSGANFALETRSFFSIFLYLIPVAAAYQAYLAFSGRAGRWPLRLLALVTGGGTLLLTVFFGLSVGSSLVMGFGYWLTALSAILLGIAAWVLPADGTQAAPLLTPQQQAELQQRGQQALSQASGWVAHKRQQVESSLEQGRIRSALGHSLSRNILDAQDQVIAPAGTVITHALIDEARQRGVLDMLLSSAERAPAASSAGTADGAQRPGTERSP